MLSPTQMTLMTIRSAEPQDRGRLADLAALDSARPLAGSALVAEVEGEPVAALEVDSGRAVSDPFVPTAKIIDLLRLRAAQVR